MCYLWQHNVREIFVHIVEIVSQFQNCEHSKSVESNFSQADGRMKIFTYVQFVSNVVESSKTPHLLQYWLENNQPVVILSEKPR